MQTLYRVWRPKLGGVTTLSPYLSRILLSGLVLGVLSCTEVYLYIQVATIRRCHRKVVQENRRYIRTLASHFHTWNISQVSSRTVAQKYYLSLMPLSPPYIPCQQSSIWISSDCAGNGMWTEAYVVVCPWVTAWRLSRLSASSILAGLQVIMSVFSSQYHESRGVCFSSQLSAGSTKILW